MRLQLIVLLLAPSIAAATDVVVSSKVQLYADTDRTVVVSPHVTGTATFDRKTSHPRAKEARPSSRRFPTPPRFPEVSRWARSWATAFVVSR